MLRTLQTIEPVWCDWPLAGRDLAWDQAPRGTTGDESGEKGGENRRGIKEKKNSASEPLGSFRSPIFFLFDCVFCLFSPLRSLVPSQA